MPSKNATPKILLSESRVQQGNVISLQGESWPLDAITIHINGIRNPSLKLITGNWWNGDIVPNAEGEFLVMLQTDNMEKGVYTIKTSTPDKRINITTSLFVEKRIEWGDDEPRNKKDKPYYRSRDFQYSRVKNNSWPDGITDVIRNELLRRNRRSVPESPQGGIVYFSNPVPGKCNWTPIGPAPFTNPRHPQGNNSGRIKSFAIDPIIPTTLYAGTASGGLWKSFNSGFNWTPISDDQPSLSIGAISIHPKNTNIIYVGTGEMVPGKIQSAYFGRGILKSTNGGNSWSVLGGSLFDLMEISRIVIHPLETETIFISASNGLWTSEDGGSSWIKLLPGSFTDVIIVQNPAEDGQLRLITGKSGTGLITMLRTPTGWGSPEEIAISGVAGGSNNITIGVCRSFPNEMYAAFSNPTGSVDLLQNVARSSDYGMTWANCTIPDSSIGYSYQASWNLSIQPHPENPEIVILAVVDVFKSIDGGKTWKNVSFSNELLIHTDTRAITFNPLVPDSLYIGTDGGVYFSADAGEHWQTRNFDISSIQIYDFGQHPQHDAIMVAGSQDNGGFFYTGAPIWKRHWVNPGVKHHSMEGDMVVAQIDPFNPNIYYYGLGPQGVILRSDDGGKLFTKSWKKFAGTNWRIPFFCCPHHPGVLYIGGDALHRSNNRGDDWLPITKTLAGTIRALGFHPTNPQQLVIGTGLGNIYRVTGPSSGEWNTTTVTVENITFSGTPKGELISSVAIDESGTIWISFSNLQKSLETGEFSNHFVYRLEAGSSDWMEKSNGLSKANPVNTLICDPADTSIVYCGADWGVFRWNNTAGMWELFDEGLPNSPVFKLQIHGPSRKIRAATHGRGLWERQLDETTCSNRFLYMRKHIADAGSEPASEGVDHPFVEGYQCWHWQSPDIVVDHTMQTTSIVTDPLTLADKVVHSGAGKGLNRIYIRVHNKGPFAVNNVKVRAYFAAASAGLPEFPSGMMNNPFSFIPIEPSEWNPVGSTFTISKIEAGTTRLAYWEFIIPESAPAHSCLMAFTSGLEDPFSSDENSNPDELVMNNRRVALRNLDLEAIPGSTGFSGELGSGGSSSVPGAGLHKIIAFHGGFKKSQKYNISIRASHVPEDSFIVIVPEIKSKHHFRHSITTPTVWSEKLKKTFADHKFHDLSGELFNKKDLLVYPLSPGKDTVLGEAILSKNKSIQLAIWIWSKKWDIEKQYRYDILQWHETRVIGGFTVELVNGAIMKSRITKK